MKNSNQATYQKQTILTMQEALEWWIKGHWLTWTFHTVEWRWVQQFCRWWITRSFQRHHARYLANKTAITPNNL